MDYLLRRLFRTAARRGLGGEHWAWFLIAGAAYLLRRARSKDQRLVTSSRLVPGDRLLITVRDRSDRSVEAAAHHEPA